MESSRIMKYIHFLKYLNHHRKALFQEFNKSKEVKRLMASEKINTFFQPIVSLEEGKTFGFEILNRPVKTLLFPTTDKFYEYVGRSNEVFMVDRFIRNLALERYAKQIKNTQKRSEQLIFLNIQPQVLADPHYQRGITLELLAKHHLSPKQIVLELTEKEAVMNYHQFEKIIEHYRQQGFRIAVDDAGTGYNSLQTLLYLKPEFMKIDKSLIRNICEHPEKQYLVELLLGFASQSETKVIAEGIETTSELNFLRTLGVHLGQGYALGKPKEELCNGQVPMVNHQLSNVLA